MRREMVGEPFPKIQFGSGLSSRLSYGLCKFLGDGDVIIIVDAHRLVERPLKIFGEVDVVPFVIGRHG